MVQRQAWARKGEEDGGHDARIREAPNHSTVSLMLRWSRTSPASSGLLAAIMAVAFVIFGCSGIDRSPSSRGAAGLVTGQECAYSFSGPRYIHPKVISPLTGLLREGWDVAAAMDVGWVSPRMGTFEVRETPSGRWVWYAGEEGFCAYRVLGRSQSGLYIVDFIENGGGSMVLEIIEMLRLESDYVLIETKGGLERRSRVLLKSMGSISVGDRYEGEITYKDGVLTISPDRSSMRINSDEAYTGQRIRID